MEENLCERNDNMITCYVVLIYAVVACSCRHQYPVLEPALDLKFVPHPASLALVRHPVPLVLDLLPVPPLAPLLILP